MHLSTLLEYCQNLEAVEECFPFDKTTLVFKTNQKMFVFCDSVDFMSITLKSDPETAIELRERYSEIIPGFHVNKKHWLTIDCKGTLSDRFILELVKASYDLVKAKRSK